MSLDAYYNQDEATKSAMNDIGMDRLQEEINSMPEEDKIFIRKSLDIQNRVHEIMKRKGIIQKDLAIKMDKHDEEVSKWLSGGHNLTLRSLAKLEAALGEPIIYCPQHVPQNPVPNEVL
jgi:ribosome-binding protein aMBF1 (putative translation factor)